MPGMPPGADSRPAGHTVGSRSAGAADTPSAEVVSSPSAVLAAAAVADKTCMARLGSGSLERRDTAPAGLSGPSTRAASLSSPLALSEILAPCVVSLPGSWEEERRERVGRQASPSSPSSSKETDGLDQVTHRECECVHGAGSLKAKATCAIDWRWRDPADLLSTSLIPLLSRKTLAALRL